uniref:Uncharacterized protein n=1 Tax=Heterorhabditis bacteriophora TaxID=37862 RepID=A0A1I7X9F0_HETBA
MAVAMRRWFDNDLPVRHRDSWWGRDDWINDWKDWPTDWPKPRDLMSKCDLLWRVLSPPIMSDCRCDDPVYAPALPPHPYLLRS